LKESEMQEPRSETRRGTPRPGETARGGVPAAFEEAYLQFGPRLRKIAMRKFRIPEHDAETIVQDVFTTYLMHMHAVNALEPYLIGAICNASRYYWRRADAAEAVFCTEQPCAATADNALVEEIERKLILSRILGRIGSRCRDLLHRYYVNGDTTAAIADSLRLKQSTIPVFLHKCRRRALGAYRSMSETS
jgi:RNA polymerase sigma factor (sigma-70 family)